jgi:hypothetical protein
MKQRYEYSEESGAGFVELSPQHVLTAEQLHDHLKKLPGVHEVRWQPTKTSQGNAGDHYSEQNLLVFPTSAKSSGLEFEVTRHQHMKDKRVPMTVTVCFKEPPRDLIGEAWRILRGVTSGKELLPDHVEMYHRKCLQRSMGTVEGPSSASPKLSVESIATDVATDAATSSGPASVSPQPVVQKGAVECSASPKLSVESIATDAATDAATSSGPAAVSPQPVVQKGAVESIEKPSSATESSDPASVPIGPKSVSPQPVLQKGAAESIEGAISALQDMVESIGTGSDTSQPLLESSGSVSVATEPKSVGAQSFYPLREVQKTKVENETIAFGDVTMNDFTGGPSSASPKEEIAFGNVSNLLNRDDGFEPDWSNDNVDANSFHLRASAAAAMEEAVSDKVAAAITSAAEHEDIRQDMFTAFLNPSAGQRICANTALESYLIY